MCIRDRSHRERSSRDNWIRGACALSLEVLSQFPCRKWELTCLPPWVAKEKMGTLLLASEMPVPIPRSRTVLYSMLPSFNPSEPSELSDSGTERSNSYHEMLLAFMQLGVGYLCISILYWTKVHHSAIATLIYPIVMCSYVSASNILEIVEVNICQSAACQACVTDT